MSCILLRGHWCDIIVLNVHAPTDDNIDDMNNSFYEEPDRVFDIVPKYNMKILLGGFNTKVGMEDISKRTIGNKSFQDISNDNGARIVNFATLKNLNAKSKLFPHHNIYKFTWTSPEGKTHNQIDHILIEIRWHLSELNVLFSGQQVVRLTTIWWQQNLGRDWK
jgi:hypothetical protein